VAGPPIGSAPQAHALYLPGGRLGYAFHPNIGFDAFLHHNATQAAFSDFSNKPLTNEGSAMLYGFEARGMVGGDGVVKAWASFGMAFGSGKLELNRSTPLRTDNASANVGRRQRLPERLGPERLVERRNFDHQRVEVRHFHRQPDVARHPLHRLHDRLPPALKFRRSVFSWTTSV
jgi:hypothetical protein